MIKNVYSIYDEKAECYNSPFPLATDGLAKRSFEEACKDPRTDLYKYPGDFKLYCIATWDENSATFQNIIPPKYIAQNNVKMQIENEVSNELDEIEKVINEEK